MPYPPGMVPCSGRDRVRLAMVAARIAIIAVSAVALTAARPPHASTDAAERILFIGNSLTFANDLPRLVQEISAYGTGLSITCESVALPNFSLEDHWLDGRARLRLAKDRWTVVVMQQGPSAGAEGRQVLREYATRFAAIARQGSARAALYTVWPSRARFRDLDGVIESYALAAKDAGGSVVPVGTAWRAALQQEPSLRLYGSDGFHPSQLGTYLAALVFREWLSGRPSTGFTASWPGSRRYSLNDTEVATLEQAAHQAVAGAR